MWSLWWLSCRCGESLQLNIWQITHHWAVLTVVTHGFCVWVHWWHNFWGKLSSWKQKLPTMLQFSSSTCSMWLYSTTQPCVVSNTSKYHSIIYMYMYYFAGHVVARVRLDCLTAEAYEHCFTSAFRSCRGAVKEAISHSSRFSANRLQLRAIKSQGEGTIRFHFDGQREHWTMVGGQSGISIACILASFPVKYNSSWEHYMGTKWGLQQCPWYVCSSSKEQSTVAYLPLHILWTLPTVKIQPKQSSLKKTWGHSLLTVSRTNTLTCFLWQDCRPCSQTRHYHSINCNTSLNFIQSCTHWQIYHN